MRAMTEGHRAYPEPGRRTPAGGAHLFTGKPNIFFVTVNAKDRVPWERVPIRNEVKTRSTASLIHSPGLAPAKPFRGREA